MLENELELKNDSKLEKEPDEPKLEKWTPARAYKMNTKVENKPKFEKWALTLNWAQASKWGQAYKWVQSQDESHASKMSSNLKLGPILKKSLGFKNELRK